MVKIIKRFCFGAFTRDSAIQCIKIIKSKSFTHVMSMFSYRFYEYL